jgi:hypothetical protein
VIPELKKQLRPVKTLVPNVSYMRMGWDFLEAPVLAPALPSGVLGVENVQMPEVGMILIY